MPAELLDSLDLVQLSYTGDERRKEQRFSYRDVTKVRVVQAAGDVITMHATTRNLSARGVCVLHRAFVYPESSMVITLCPDGETPIHVAGKVLACRYVGQSHHETSMKFDEKIGLERFLTAAAEGRAQSHLDRSHRRLDGVRIVIIDSPDEERSQISQLFEELGADLMLVSSLGKSIDIMRTSPVDLLICRGNHDGADAPQIVGLCRNAGYTRPIIALGWEPDELANAQALHNAGMIIAISPESQEEALDLIEILDLRPTTS